MKTAQTRDSLTKQGNSDYTLETDSVWITIKGFSIYLKKTSEGVICDIYEKGVEYDDPITSAYAFDGELLKP